MNATQLFPPYSVTVGCSKGSPEAAELRRIERLDPTPKASMLIDATKRALLYFLQAMALRPGGLKALASGLVEKFPERLGSPTMHKLGISAKRVYSPGQADRIRIELRLRPEFSFNDEPTAAAPDADNSAECFLQICRSQAASQLGDFLEAVCSDPTMEIRLPEDREFTVDLEREKLRDLASETADWRISEVPYFRDLVGALLEFQCNMAQQARDAVAQTEVAGRVFGTLDRALSHRKMVVLEGDPGIGKTKAAEAWCEAHNGQARFVTLSGCVNKTSIFRAIGRALGVGCGYHRSLAAIQARVEDALKRSGLMLVIDEAHFLFGQSERMQTRPVMLDWVDTALCNQGVPVALIATPQFSRRLDQAERETIWQSAQFRRRVKDYVRLPSAMSQADLDSVTRKLLPNSDRASIKLATGYAKLSRWPLTGLANLAEDARVIAAECGRTEPNFADLEAAMTKFRMPSDVAQATAFEEASKTARRGRRCPTPQPQPIQRQNTDEEPADTARSSDTRALPIGPRMGELVTA